MGYVGSEEFIRLQFEEYLLSLISSVKCHNYLLINANNPNVMLPQVDGDPSADFGTDWIDAWSRTENYRIWNKNTDSHLFDIVEPKHPCAGSLTIDDVQRRIAQQVQDLQLDQRFAAGREVLGRNLAAGKEKASTVFNKLYADMELLRENQRRRQQEQKALAEKNGTPPTSPGFVPDIAKAQATVQSVGSKAGAYMSSWASWAGEKRKTGWGKPAPAKPKVEEEIDFPIRDITPVEIPARFSSPEVRKEKRPEIRQSYSESIFDAAEESEAKDLSDAKKQSFDDSDKSQRSSAQTATTLATSTATLPTPEQNVSELKDNERATQIL
jgi:hypothetical protein